MGAARSRALLERVYSPRFPRIFGGAALGMACAAQTFARERARPHAGWLGAPSRAAAARRRPRRISRTDPYLVRAVPIGRSAAPFGCREPRSERSPLVLRSRQG